MSRRRRLTVLTLTLLVGVTLTSCAWHVAGTFPHGYPGYPGSYPGSYPSPEYAHQWAYWCDDPPGYAAPLGYVRYCYRGWRQVPRPY